MFQYHGIDASDSPEIKFPVIPRSLVALPAYTSHRNQIIFWGGRYCGGLVLSSLRRGRRVSGWLELCELEASLIPPLQITGL